MISSLFFASLFFASIANTVIAVLLALGAIVAARFSRRPQLAHIVWLLVLGKLILPPVAFLLPIPNSVSLEIPSTVDGESSGPKKVSEAATIKEANPAASLGVPKKIRTTLEQSQPNSHSAIKVDNGQLVWVQLLVFVWAIGAVVATAMMLRSARSVLRLVRESTPADCALENEASQIAGRLGISRCPRVVISRHRVPPFVFGFLSRPTIVLPKALLPTLSRPQLVSILTHELAHIRRRDHWVRYLEALVRIFHWWNPLYWLALSQINKAEEKCCDAWVVWAQPESRREYGRALYATVEFLTCEPRYSSVLGTEFGRSAIKGRIEMILNENPERRIGKLAFTILVAIGLVVLPLGWTQGTGIEEPATEWSNFLQNPYSERAFRKAFPDASKRADTAFGNWYLSGLYKGETQDGQEFYVVQTYDGEERVSFRFGFLLVVDAQGQPMEIIHGMRICSGDLEEKEREYLLSKKPIAVQLPDLTGNGVSDLVTEQWHGSGGTSYAIYRNNHGEVQHVFSIGFEPTNGEMDVCWGGWQLVALDGAKDGFALQGRLYGPVDEARSRELVKRIKLGNVADGRYFSPASIRIVSSYDETQSPRVLATFEWSEEESSYVGPMNGPGGIWKAVNSLALDAASQTK